jgi:hypothetical protein
MPAAEATESVVSGLGFRSKVSRVSMLQGFARKNQAPGNFETWETLKAYFVQEDRSARPVNWTQNEQEKKTWHVIKMQYVVCAAARA